jgi:TRAP-type C4-dicarboxylate transport system substrate-binding protein
MYKNIKRISKKKFESIFLNNQIDKLKIAIISISLYENDQLWLENNLIEMFLASDSDIIKSAITGFSHYTRRFGRISSIELVFSKLNKLSENSECRGLAEDFFEDYEIFKSNS